jgi:hypothetical protein
MGYDKQYEEYKKWKDDQEKLHTKIAKNLEPKHYVLIVVFVIFLGYLAFGREDISQNLILFIGAGAFLVIAYFFTRATNEKKPLPEWKVKMIVSETLRAKEGHEDWIPTGTEIKLTGFCKLIYWGGEDSPYKWAVGVKLRLPNNLMKEYRVVVHPYDGYITAIENAPTGYDATTDYDIKPVYVYEYYKTT